MADASELFSTQTLFADKRVAAGFQRFLGVHADGDVGNITRRAINQRFGGSSENHEVKSEAIIGLQRQLGLPETGLVDRHMIEAFDKKFRDYQSPAASAQAPTGGARARANGLTRSLLTPAGQYPPLTPAPTIRTGLVAPSVAQITEPTQATFLGYAFSAHGNDYRYIAAIENGNVNSRIEVKVNGKYIPQASVPQAYQVLPRQQAGLDDFVAGKYQARTQAPYLLTAQQASDSRFEPPPMYSVAMTNFRDPDFHFFQDGINAKKAMQEAKNISEKLAYLKAHPDKAAELIQEYPRTFRTMYNEDRELAQAVNTYRRDNPATSLTNIINSTLGLPANASGRMLTMASRPN
jgi:hypothetical protein